MKFRFTSPHTKIFLVMILAMGICGWVIGEVHDIHDKAKVTGMTETMKTICVGRFLIDVPAEAKVSFQGAFLSGWSIDTDPDETDEQFTARLAQKEMELKAEKNEKGGNSLESTTHIDSSGMMGKIFVFRRTWAYWFEGERRIDSTAVAIDAYVHSHKTSLNFTAKSLDPEDAKELIKIVSQIKTLQEYEIPTEPGFCIGCAMLLDPLTASQNERVTMFLSLKDHPDFLIALDTAAGLKPSEPLLIREAKSRGVFASHLKSYRRGPRTIGGIPGGEIVDGFHEDNGTTGYSCEWASIPDQNDVFRPELDLEFTSGHSTRPGGQPVESSLSAQAILMLWDKISSTIRIRPTQVVKVPVAEVIPPSLGAIVHANEACPATGWWQCDVDYETAKIESGARQYFRKGDRMPQAVMLAPPTLGQRLKRQQPRFQSEIPTRWKLVQLVS